MPEQSGYQVDLGKEKPLEAPSFSLSVLSSTEHLNQARYWRLGSCHIRQRVKACPCDTAHRELWKTNPFPHHVALSCLEVLLHLCHQWELRLSQDRQFWVLCEDWDACHPTSLMSSLPVSQAGTYWGFGWFLHALQTSRACKARQEIL